MLRVSLCLMSLTGCSRSTEPDAHTQALLVSQATLQQTVDDLLATSIAQEQTIADLQRQLTALAQVQAEPAVEDAPAEVDDGADLTAMLLQLKADLDELDALDEVLGELEEDGGERDDELDELEAALAAAIERIEAAEARVNELDAEQAQHLTATRGVDSLMSVLTINEQGDVVFTGTNVLIRPGPGSGPGRKGQLFMMDSHDGYPYAYRQ